MALDDRLRATPDAPPDTPVERAPPSPAHSDRTLLRMSRALRKRFSRAAWMAIGFAATLAFAFALAVRLHAELSRLPPWPTPLATLESAPGDGFLTAVVALHGLRAQGQTVNDDRRMFATAALRRREAYFLAGAETAAAVALNEMPVARGARNAALRDARTLSTSTALDDRRQLGAALVRLDSAADAGRVAFDRSPDALEVLVAAAAADLELRAEALAAETGAGRVTERAEAGFYSARGAAFGWAVLLRGAGVDAEESDMSDALGPALAALDRAAHAAPLFLSNDDPMGEGRANHLSALALELSLAKDSLRRAHAGEADLSAPPT